MSENSCINVIDFLCDINGNTINSLLEILQDIDKVDFGKSSKIIIRINSRGGVLGHATRAYRKLLDYPKERLTIHNIGSVESAAILLYLSAKTRAAIPGSRFLIHPICWTYNYHPKITLSILEKAKKDLERDIKCYASIWKDNTRNGNNPKDICRYLENSSYDPESDSLNFEKDTLIIDASDALSCGIITQAPANFNVPERVIFSVVKDS